MAQRLTGHAVTKSRGRRSCRRSSRSCGQAAVPDAHGDVGRRLAALTFSRSVRRRRSAVFPTSAARILLARQQLLQLRDVGRGLLGRQVGLHDVFGLGDTALQAHHQRQIGAHARIGRRAGCRRGAASPRPSADPSKARRTVRDWTAPTARRARSSARSHNIAAPPRSGRADRASRPAPTGSASRDRQGYGRGRARRRPAGNCRCRPARGRSRRAAPCCRDGRWRPVRAPRPPATAVPSRAAPCRISARRRHPSDWRDSAPGRASTSRRGSLARPVSALSPSEPVMSESPDGLAAAKPQRQDQECNVHARSRVEAGRMEQLLEHVAELTARNCPEMLTA